MSTAITDTAPAGIEIDDESAALLAKMDSRGVAESQLLLIFRCSAEELQACRQAESYKDALGLAVLEMEQQAADLDTSWDDIEARASADLREQLSMGAIVDARQLLQVATTANKAARRSAAQAADGLERQKAAKEGANLNAGRSVVIRLRTRFVEQLDTPAGHQQLLDREAEVIAEAPQNMIDKMGVADVRRHLTQSLGINLDELKTGGRSGPDMSLEDAMQFGPGGRANSIDLTQDMFAHVDDESE